MRVSPTFTETEGKSFELARRNVGLSDDSPPVSQANCCSCNYTCIERSERRYGAVGLRESASEPTTKRFPGFLEPTSHIWSWKRRRSFSISSAISAPVISVRIIPCCLACSRFSFSIFVLSGEMEEAAEATPTVSLHVIEPVLVRCRVRCDARNKAVQIQSCQSTYNFAS